MFFRKTLDIITLFHKAGSPASARVAALLTQASATASAGKGPREAFDLNVTEDPPTTEQLSTILEYVGTPGIPAVVTGAATTHEALKKFRESAANFQRPLVVDWNNGTAVTSDKESEILKLLNLKE